MATPHMEQIEEDREMVTPRRRPVLRSQMSEPAPSYTDFKGFTGHEHYMISYDSQFCDDQPGLLNSIPCSSTTSRPSPKYYDDEAPSELAKGSIRRKSTDISGSSSDYISTNQYSVFYSSVRSQASLIGLALTGVPPCIPVSAPIGCQTPFCTSMQTPTQTPTGGKHRLKAVFIVDSKTTEILVANDNVKRFFGFLHETLIGRRFTDIFSSNIDDEPPVILHNELVTVDRHLKEVYGRAIDIIDSQGERVAVSAWSYPLTQAAADATKETVSGKKHSMLMRTLSAVITPGRRTWDPASFHSNPNWLSVSNYGNKGPSGTHASASQDLCAVDSSFPEVTSNSSTLSSCSLQASSQGAPYGRSLPAETESFDAKEMVQGTAYPLVESVHCEKFNADIKEKDGSHEEKGQAKGCAVMERRHMTDGAASRRWLILMEPINAVYIACTLGAKGRIFRVDDSMATLLGYASMRELLGTEIEKLIPALKLDVEDAEQHVCAVGVRGNSIPVTVRVSAEKDPATQCATMYELQIRALSAVNGVVTLTDSGNLHSFNENFIEALVGKERKNLALNDDANITDLIPDFHSHIHSNYELCDKIPEDPCASVSETQYLHSEFFEKSRGLPATAATARASTSLPDPSHLAEGLSALRLLDTIDSASSSHSSSADEDASSTSLPKKKSNFDLNDGDLLSDACECNEDMSTKCRFIREGSFFGLAKHSDSSLIAVRFDIRRLEMGFPANWVVCIGYDRNIDFGLFGDGDALRKDSDAACSSVDNEEDSYLESKRCDSSAAAVSLQTLEDENADAVRGEYSQNYNTFHLIGNGAFGSVKLAARKDTGLLAVAKFVCKGKVLPEGWVTSPMRGNTMIPIEVHLLETLTHPNIVKVLDVFQNDTYYQLVMEKLGCGMDLFEFIDHQPRLDEPLTSYIFRQVVSAVAYLHANKIVHRDVKDENVIIDQNFSCKLIDFGSAAYFGRDIMFSTFCGTMEYCSPEVLSGNKYRGPELEMWSLGVLLYTLVYFENPFRTPQETVRAEVELPWDVSDGLFHVIAWLLHRDPRLRATVNDIKNHWWTQQPVNLRRYKFQEMLKSCERAQIDPPQYASELATRLKNASSCSALDIDLNRSIQDANPMHAR